jgi:hypothetical protein
MTRLFLLIVGARSREFLSHLEWKGGTNKRSGSRIISARGTETEKWIRWCKGKIIQDTIALRVTSTDLSREELINRAMKFMEYIGDMNRLVI